MSQLDLRPLSTGEILDRTFTLYRQHFLLFVALAAIPRIPALAVSLFQSQRISVATNISDLPMTIGLGLLSLVVSVVGYIYAQGGAVSAVSQLYLGRGTTIVESFRRVTDDLGSLFGVLILNGMAILVGLIFLIVPGIYVMCRLLACVPAALIEKKGPAESLRRSFDLTQGFAGRAFLILLLYFCVFYGFAVLIGIPMGLAIATGHRTIEELRLWTGINVIGTALVEYLVTPVLLIATAIYYYDLRVRKEAFDLQIMMDPDGSQVPRATARSVVPEGQ